MASCVEHPSCALVGVPLRPAMHQPSLVDNSLCYHSPLVVKQFELHQLLSVVMQLVVNTLQYLQCSRHVAENQVYVRMIIYHRPR